MLCDPSSAWAADLAKGHAFFEAEIRPILIERCYECHSEEAGKRKGGLWLDRRAAWQTGGDTGSAIIPWRPEESPLVHAIRYTDPDFQMPPKTKLSDGERANLEKWVRMGAPDPRDEAMVGAVRDEEIDYDQAPSSAWAADLAKGHAFFEAEIRPILIERCYECHSEEAGKRKGGLWLDRRAAWQTGGDTGSAIIPWRPEESPLVHAIRYTDPDFQMPPKTKLSDGERANLEKWVRMGAPDPRDEAMVGAVRDEEIDYDQARRNWAFRPANKMPPPAIENTAWAKNNIDRFILAALEEKELHPSEDASPEALLRRLHYDLTGLPPTRAELNAFLRDYRRNPASSIEYRVDHLLADPAFGEKWGRHWLDVARYADSNGGDRNFTFYQAWRYRDYVIDAFNDDKSYYDFVREQLAGDLLPAKSPGQRRAQLIGSTFLTLGPKMITERDKEKLSMDIVDEQIDTMGRAFLGLTLGCARCHDHKFDPVSQEDYYALAGFFRSTQVLSGTRTTNVNVYSWLEQPLPVAGPEDKELEQKVARLELVQRLALEKVFKNKAGGKMANGMLPFAGAIYDESDAELIGAWKESTFLVNRFGDQYVHDDQKNKGANRAIFRGGVPESGLYEIRIAYNPGPNRAKNVPVTVEARNGETKVELDQTKTPVIGGLFQPIGRFPMEKGGHCNVTIETGGTDKGFVIVDAVQFIHVDDIPREAMYLAAVDTDGLDPAFKMSEDELEKELEKIFEDLKYAELAMAPRDARDADDCHLRFRGEVDQLGDRIPRRFPLALDEGPAPEIAPGTSGRLQLADWIIQDDNALLDRVIVNRAWHHLFGRGIVASVDNFGRLGAMPTDPDLLDYLTASFRESGGSIKQLVRELVLSRTYQLSSTAAPKLAVADPVNDLFGRQNRRRLTAEEIRDSYLLLSGRLDTKPPGPTATAFGEDLDEPMTFEKENFRTVYLPVARNNRVAELEIFDAANPDLVTGARAETTVPTQALYLLNSEAMKMNAALLAEKAFGHPERDGSVKAAVTWLYQTLLARRPSRAEIDRALDFVAALATGAESGNSNAEALTHVAHILMASTEFLYLD